MQVVDAETGQPLEGVVVLVYSSASDRGLRPAVQSL
jgi:hypothetical protein